MHEPAVDEAPARVLALVVAANGRIDERVLQALDRLDAFRRLGVTRHRFVELARGCLRQQEWLRAAPLACLDAWLDEVREPSRRLIVCRLAAAALVADGRVTKVERMAYERVLSRWHISQMTVCREIMCDPAR